jgi:hypothetical protein
LRKYGGEDDAVAALDLAHGTSPLHMIRWITSARTTSSPLMRMPRLTGRRRRRWRLARREVARILAEGRTHVADRADAEADEIALRVRRVTHEVAMQGARLARDRKLVARQGEVIHADVDVSGGGEPVDGKHQELELALGRRQRRPSRCAAARRTARQVRVAVDGEAIRRDGDTGVERRAEAVRAIALATRR